MLTVISEVTEKYKPRRFLCKCDCWKFKEVALVHLRSWKTTSCRCIHSKMVSDRFKKHWLSHTRCERIFRDMIRRCTKEKSISYINYGWRGIIVEWNNTSEFILDMYDSYIKHVEEFWEKNTTIDRIDNNWNYCKENCKWSTRMEQWMNTRRVRKVLFRWELLHLSEIGRRLWVSLDVIRSRVNRWVSIE